MRRRRAGVEERAALASRFVSDAETLEGLTVAVLDQGAVSLFDLTAALVVLGLLDRWLVAVALVGAGAAALTLRRLRRPAGAAAAARQEALERLAAEVSRRGGGDRSFASVVGRVAATELRLGWVTAVNRHSSLALAGLGPVVVLVAGAAGGLRAGLLVSAYLLAGRAFAAVETLLDVSFDAEVAGSSVRRCFALVEADAAASFR